jgi:hypothetical protein
MHRKRVQESLLRRIMHTGTTLAVVPVVAVLVDASWEEPGAFTVAIYWD